MRIRRVATVAAVLVASTAAARADLVFSSGNSTINNESGFLSPADGTTTANLQAADGTYFTVSSGDSGEFFTLQVPMAAGAAGNSDLRIFLGKLAAAVDSVELIRVNWIGGGKNAFIQFGTAGVAGTGFALTPSAFASGTNDWQMNIIPRVLNHAVDVTGYDSVDAGFDWYNLTEVDLIIQFNSVTGGANSGSVQIDAISNPEPATFMLFGMGAFGAGLAAWSRKRKATAKKTSAA